MQVALDVFQMGGIAPGAWGGKGKQCGHGHSSPIAECKPPSWHLTCHSSILCLWGCLYWWNELLKDKGSYKFCFIYIPGLYTCLCAWSLGGCSVGLGSKIHHYSVANVPLRKGKSRPQFYTAGAVLAINSKYIFLLIHTRQAFIYLNVLFVIFNNKCSIHALATQNKS